MQYARIIMKLTVDNLHVAYGAIKALKGVSLEVDEGEIVALIGSNGAGKTTLVRTISGLLPMAQGKICYGSVTISSLKAHAIVSEGIVQVPEGRWVFENLSVLENLELGAYIHKSSVHFKKDLEEVFFLFPRLKERLSQLSGTLSGGEQQMLAIGRALMSRPKLLLLDEPSLGIAPKLTQQIFQSLKIVHEKGVAILLIEQDANLALKMADRAYVLETGEIKLSGKGSELLRNPEVKKAYLGGS